MVNRKKLSVALATYNEEANILDCINSVKGIADEIVVVDGRSTDNTFAIAKKAGAAVISVENNPMFHINKNIAITKCSGEWILLLDADERVSAELALEIKEKINRGGAVCGYWINRKNWFLGRFLKKGGVYPDRVIRLFKNGKGRLPEKNVHEQILIDGDLDSLSSDLIHLADPNFRRYLVRANRYTTQTAGLLEAENVGISTLSTIKYSLIIPILTFTKVFFRHKGFRDGFAGFVWALFSGFHYFYAYAKHWEKVEKIDQKYDLD